MFPIALLPFWVHPAAYILGPTWGVDAIRLATSTDYASQSFWVGVEPFTAIILDIAMMIAITLIYAVVAIILFKAVEKRARIKGTLVQA
jgi:ABC-2 type transport system permease protein